MVDTNEGGASLYLIEEPDKTKTGLCIICTFTYGNSSQINDPAAFLILISERMINKLGLKSIAMLDNCTKCWCTSRYHGPGAGRRILKLLRQTGMGLADIALFKFNQALASQSLAIIRSLGLNPAIVEINGRGNFT